MIQIADNQVRAFADFMRDNRGIRPFDFCSLEEGHLFPPRDQLGVADYFFFATAHQFGFWYLKDGRYERPMYARVDGREWKGSDFLWRCATKAWNDQRDIFHPRVMEHVTDEEWSRIFSDDEGRNPLPMWEEHLRIIHECTRWCMERNTTPGQLIRDANASDAPLKTFLDQAGRVPGYAEDPLHKKLILLAIILENRPEHFLRVGDPQHYEPIIDYHLQRSALRTGLVEVTDDALRRKLVERRLVTPGEESSVRRAVFEAIRRLMAESGLSIAAIDYFFFMNRKRCPEMTEPDCPRCEVNALCAKHKALFQPVYRTEDY